MKIINYKQLSKERANTCFATINRMNELGEVLVIGQYPDGQKYIYSPLSDVSHAGSSEIDFDANTFSRTGTFVVFDKEEIKQMIQKLHASMDFDFTSDKAAAAEEAPQAQVASAPIKRVDNLVPIIPILTGQTATCFVSGALVPPRKVVLNSGATVLTAPLAIGAELSLLGIGETKSLLESGIMDTTDSLDPDISLGRVYVLLETQGKDSEVVPIDLTRRPTAQAHMSAVSYSQMQLNFNESVTFAAGQETLVGVPSKILTQGWVTKLVVSGTINLQLSHTRFVALHIESFQQDRSLVRARVVAYDLKAYRTNLNRKPIAQEA